MNSPMIWNAKGLIFSPQETEENFYKRCETASCQCQSPISSLAKHLFDIDPDWVEIHYSNKGLRFWEGGCTWIENYKISLQLPKTLEHKKCFLGMYSKEEILAHELVHVVRHMFVEPIFEEVLAYQTSTSKFRRFFGPMFRTSRETTATFLLFFLLLGTTFTPFFQLGFAAIVSFVGLGFYRLFRTQSTFQKTKSKLARLTSPQKALFIMVRLTDQEIIFFSKMKEDEILSYLEKKRETDLRWQQIAFYF